MSNFDPPGYEPTAYHQIIMLDSESVHLYAIVRNGQTRYYGEHIKRGWTKPEKFARALRYQHRLYSLIDKDWKEVHYLAFSGHRLIRWEYDGVLEKRSEETIRERKEKLEQHQKSIMNEFNSPQ